MSASNLSYQTDDDSALTPAQIARLDALEARIGDGVDIPPTADEAWSTSVSGKHSRPARSGSMGRPVTE